MYRNKVSTPKQETFLTSGRVKQKQRTRRALVDAARELARQGRPVTITEAADVAQVSPATAYRYFSSPEELLGEIALASAAQFIEDLPDTPSARLTTVIDRVCDAQFSDQVVWRTSVMASLQRWLAQAASTDDLVPVRAGARLDITRAVLEPLEAQLAPDVLRKLTMALVLVYGAEAMISSFDVARLQPEEARSVMQWAASALLATALRESGAAAQ